MNDSLWKTSYFTDFGKVYVSKRKDGSTLVRVKNARGVLRFIVSKTGFIRVV